MTRDLSAFEQNLVTAMTEQARAVEPPRFDAPGIIDTERRRTRRRVSLTVVSFATAAGIAACVAGSPSGSGRTGPPIVPATGVTGTTPTSAPSLPTPTPSDTGVPSSEPSAATASAGALPFQNVSKWPTGPTSSPFRGSVPPVPTLLWISKATSVGYDRVSFKFTGQLPGYSAAYVKSVIAGGSGATLSMPGNAYLQLTFRSAQGGSGSVEHTLDPHAEVMAYAVTQDFEGVVTVVLGLSAKHGYHIGVLTNSATDHVIYVDIAK